DLHALLLTVHGGVAGERVSSLHLLVSGAAHALHGQSVAVLQHPLDVAFHPFLVEHRRVQQPRLPEQHHTRGREQHHGHGDPDPQSLARLLAGLFAAGRRRTVGLPGLLAEGGVLTVRVLVAVRVGLVVRIRCGLLTVLRGAVGLPVSGLLTEGRLLTIPTGLGEATGCGISGRLLTPLPGVVTSVWRAHRVAFRLLSPVRPQSCVRSRCHGSPPRAAAPKYNHTPYTPHSSPAATTPRRSNRDAFPAAPPTGCSLPSTSLICSSRSTTCRDHRTKSPADNSCPFTSAEVRTFSKDSPRAHRYTGHANPASGSRVGSNRCRRSSSTRSLHRRTVSCHALLTGPAGTLASAVESRRASYTKVETTAASSAGARPCQTRCRMHSAASRSDSLYRRASSCPCSVTSSPLSPR